MSVRKVTQREEQLQWHLARSQRPPQRLRGRPVPKSPPPDPTKSSGFPLPAGSGAGTPPPSRAGDWEDFDPPQKPGAKSPFPRPPDGPNRLLFFFFFSQIFDFFSHFGSLRPRSQKQPGGHAEMGACIWRGGGLTEQHHQLLVMPISSSGTAPAPRQEEEEALNSWSTRPR